MFFWYDENKVELDFGIPALKMNMILLFELNQPLMN